MNLITEGAGMSLILAERERQITSEGWTLEHDDDHGSAILENAAYCYRDAEPDTQLPSLWPWPESAWKPRDRQRNLMRAGALYLAAAQAAERANLYTSRDELNDQVRSCAIRLESIISTGQ